MGWVKAAKWPETNVSVLLNCPSKPGDEFEYILGWHDGIGYRTKGEKGVSPTEWHKLPSPPIRDNKLVKRTN